MIENPVPWPEGARVAVAFTFDVDADSLIHIAHPDDAATRVSTTSICATGPRWPCRGSAR